VLLDAFSAEDAEKARAAGLKIFHFNDVVKAGEENP